MCLALTPSLPKSVYDQCVLQTWDCVLGLDLVQAVDFLDLEYKHSIDFVFAYCVYPKWGLRPKKMVAQFFLGKYLQIRGGDSNSPHF